MGVVSGDERGHVRGGGEGGVDLGGVARFAVVEPAEGEFETVGATAALEGQIGEVVDFGVGGRGCGGGVVVVVVVVEEVARGQGVGGVELAQVGG